VRKHYTPALKAQLVLELLKQEKTLAQLAAKYGVHPSQLVKCHTIALDGLPSLFTKQDSTAALTPATKTDSRRCPRRSDA
jgi:transposase-like protein